ncbi:MAG: hypothetical protein AAF517_11990, partial [Planctomycetota bacterium]
MFKVRFADRRELSRRKEAGTGGCAREFSDDDQVVIVFTKEASAAALVGEEQSSRYLKALGGELSNGRVNDGREVLVRGAGVSKVEADRIAHG